MTKGRTALRKANAHSLGLPLNQHASKSALPNEITMSHTVNNTQDTNLAVTLTVVQLRALVREEVEAAIGSGRNLTQTQRPHTSKAYLTIKEAAELARISPSTIRLYVRKRKLRAQKVGRRVIIKRTDLERFLEALPFEVQ